MISRQVVIIGAGTSGVATAVALADRGIKPLLLDQADRVGSSWRSRYDRLRLNTGRQFSHLPGRPYPKGTPTFPTRDQVIDHLERHPSEDGIELCLGRTAERLDRGDGHWRLTTSTGAIEAAQVVVATGFDHVPFVPDWPGRDEWPGDLAHSTQYRNPLPYAGKRVLVVGPGCSGMEIAYDLATAVRPRCGSRSARRRTSCSARGRGVYQAISSRRRSTTPRSASPMRLPVSAGE